MLLIDWSQPKKTPQGAIGARNKFMVTQLGGYSGDSKHTTIILYAIISSYQHALLRQKCSDRFPIGDYTYFKWLTETRKREAMSEMSYHLPRATIILSINASRLGYAFNSDNQRRKNEHLKKQLVTVFLEHYGIWKKLAYGKEQLSSFKKEVEEHETPSHFSPKVKLLDKSLEEKENEVSCSDTLRGWPLCDFVSHLLRFTLIFSLILLRLLFNYAYLRIKFYICIFLACIIQTVYVWVWTTCFKSISCVFGTRTIYEIGSSHVTSRILKYL